MTVMTLRTTNGRLAKEYDALIRSLPVDTDPKILTHLHSLRDDLLSRQAGGIYRSRFADRVTLEAYRKMLS